MHIWVQSLKFGKPLPEEFIDDGRRSCNANKSLEVGGVGLDLLQKIVVNIQHGLRLHQGINAGGG